MPLKPKNNKKQKRASGEKNHLMKNDPYRKSLPHRVNNFFRKGPLRPEKSKKRASEASDKSHKMKNDPLSKIITTRSK